MHGVISHRPIAGGARHGPTADGGGGGGARDCNTPRTYDRRADL